MGFFDLFRKKKPIHNDVAKEIVPIERIGSPAAGMAVPLSEVEDATFRQGIMGKGMAVRPFEGRIVSPVDGEITMVFKTNHALTIKTQKGTEILIHIGIDTVSLLGKYFHPKVETGQLVQKGQDLVYFDLEEIKKAGFYITTPMVILNSEDSDIVNVVTDREVSYGEDVITIQSERRKIHGNL